MATDPLPEVAKTHTASAEKPHIETRYFFGCTRALCEEGCRNTATYVVADNISEAFQRFNNMLPYTGNNKRHLYEYFGYLTVKILPTLAPHDDRIAHVHQLGTEKCVLPSPEIVGYETLSDPEKTFNIQRNRFGDLYVNDNEDSPHISILLFYIWLAVDMRYYVVSPEDYYPYLQIVSLFNCLARPESDPYSIEHDKADSFTENGVALREAELDLFLRIENHLPNLTDERYYVDYFHNMSTRNTKYHKSPYIRPLPKTHQMHLSPDETNDPFLDLMQPNKFNVLGLIQTTDKDGKMYWCYFT